MMERIAKLEAGQDAIRREMDLRFDGIDKRLDRIESKIPTKWDMAQVVFFVVGSLMAAAIFGPRLISIIERAGGV